PVTPALIFTRVTTGVDHVRPRGPFGSLNSQSSFGYGPCVPPVAFGSVMSKASTELPPLRMPLTSTVAHSLACLLTSLALLGIQASAAAGEPAHKEGPRCSAFP